jgi:16S rRNA (uracil1498-N3)-methyltransferase
MQLFFEEHISENGFDLGPEESKHLVKVLRKSIGDQVYFTNGKGFLYTCKIERLDLKKTELSVINKEYHSPDNFYIHLAIAPTKNQDKMEWMVEKITEIGFNEITFIQTENCERSFLKMDRIEKKIISACKQSHKMWKPVVNPRRNFAEILQDPQFENFQRFIGHVDHENQPNLFGQASKKSSYLVLIGPEGDFSPEEIRMAKGNRFKACSLGRYRLRTETAGMVAVHTLNLVQDYQ